MPLEVKCDAKEYWALQLSSVFSCSWAHFKLKPQILKWDFSLFTLFGNRNSQGTKTHVHFWATSRQGEKFVFPGSWNSTTTWYQVPSADYHWCITEKHVLTHANNFCLQNGFFTLYVITKNHGRNGWTKVAISSIQNTTLTTGKLPGQLQSYEL